MAKAKSKPSIFISHISKEAALAEAIQRNITKDFLQMVDVFVSSDSSSIEVGRKWLEEVTEALKKADLEIVLCSKESVQRPWVNFEAGAGWVKGIPIIPICHTDMKPIDLPVPLNMLQAIEASNLSSIKKLYSFIGELLGAAPPGNDINAIITEIKEIETQYRNERIEIAMEANTLASGNPFPDVRRILKPRILCASTTMFESLGFEKDIEVLEKYFPGQVTIEHNVTSRSLREQLTEHRYDIIHILAYIGKNGDLIFVESTIELKSKSKHDCITAEGFAALLQISKTSLVVLASCDSLPLAATLNRKTNLVASMDEIGIEPTYQWEDCFYGFLSKGFSVQKAFELSKSLHNLPMLLVPHNDLAFAQER